MGDTKTIRTDLVKEKKKAIPKDAVILSQNTTTDVESIENGYLVTKRTETRYREKGADKYGTEWHTDTVKIFSKTNPVKISSKVKGLADMFDESDAPVISETDKSDD